MVQALPQYNEQMEKLTLHVEVCFPYPSSSGFIHYTVYGDEEQFWS